MTHASTWDYLYSNRVAIGLFFAAVGTAAVKTAPLPGTPWTREVIYAWVYDLLHQLLNITNTRLATSPVITPPASKEDAASK